MVIRKMLPVVAAAAAAAADWHLNLAGVTFWRQCRKLQRKGMYSKLLVRMFFLSSYSYSYSSLRWYLYLTRDWTEETACVVVVVAAAGMPMVAAQKILP